MAKLLGRIDRLLQPGEQYLWHAPIAVGGKRGDIGLPMLALIAGSVATVFAAIVAHPIWLVVTAVFAYGYYSLVKIVTEPYHTLIATNKRLLVVTPRMRVETEFAYERIETTSVPAGVRVEGHRGDLTIKWICVANARHAEHLTRQLPPTND